MAAMDENLDDFDIDVVIQALDTDLSSGHEQFRGGACCYSAIFSDADIVSHCRLNDCADIDGDGGGSGAAPGGGCSSWLLARLLMGDDHHDYCGDGVGEDLEEAGSSSSPDSGVTAEDGTFALAAGDDVENDAEAMSAYVAELERFLLEDETPCGEQADGLLSVVDYYFDNDDQLLFLCDS